MPFLIGQCCVDQVLTSPDDVAGISGLNEPVEFTNVATYILQWNATRKARFGTHGVFQVWIYDTNGVPLISQVQGIPDSLTNPSFYTFDMGGLASGYIIIT